MPLRDHFRPPFSTQLSWEEFHGMWPAAIVQQLRKLLPPGYVAGPKAHSGSHVEVDVAAFEKGDSPFAATPDGGGGTATAVWAPARPSVVVETELPDYDEYEVRVYDATRGRTLVAAIELVSPANKDRPEHRNVFVAKCAALLQKGVAVSVVDLVSVRRFNLYLDLLELIGHTDETLGEPTPHLYAASCRWVRRGDKSYLETWSHVLTVGQWLPTIPLWLSPERAVPLDLEQSYEQACQDLWVT
jgi:hypothetical protein